MIHVAVNVHNNVWTKAYYSTGSPFCPDLDDICASMGWICAFCGVMICVLLFPFIYIAICNVQYSFVSNVHHDEPIIHIIGFLLTVSIYLLMGYLIVKCQESKNSNRRNSEQHSTRWNTNIQMQTYNTRDLAVEIPSAPSGQIEVANLRTSYSECDLLNPPVNVSVIPESRAPSCMHQKIYI